MPRRRTEYKGKYKLDKHEFNIAYHHALMYQSWLSEYNALADPSTGLRYDKEHVQGNPLDTTEKNGMRRAELRERMKVVEQAAIETDPELYQYILMGVTFEDMTFDMLQARHHIPCARNTYYERRRRFYWILWQRIEKFSPRGT
jgi:hypothetical protein